MGQKKVRKIICRFFAGLGLAFTIEILVMALAAALVGEEVLPIYMIFEGFALVVLCAFIGAVFSADRLAFGWQIILTYIFTLTAVILFALIFDWHVSGADILQGKNFFLVLIPLFTAFYALTIIILRITQLKNQKRLNEKLEEYKEKA